MKSKTVSAKGKQECFCREWGDRGREDDGGEIEARRTRGLDLRRREQLKVMMSAWRQEATAYERGSDWRDKGSGLQGHSLPHGFYCISPYHAY